MRFEKIWGSSVLQTYRQTSLSPRWAFSIGSWGKDRKENGHINYMFLGLIPHPLAPPHLTAPLGARLFTDRKGNVIFLQVFVCSQSASWLLVHCLFLLLYGQYVSYWNAFFFKHIFWTSVMQKFKFDDQPRKVEFNSFVMYWEKKDLLHSVYSKKNQCDWNGTDQYIIWTIMTSPWFLNATGFFF